MRICIFHRFIKITKFLLLLVVVPVYAADKENTDEIIDESIQTASVYESKGQWVPVPIPVSNPTVGTGLQAVLMYLHPKHAESTHNSTTGLVGMYTDTDSWFTSIFHDGSSVNDTIRYTGFLGAAHMNLHFYGIGDSTIIGDRSIPYGFDMIVTSGKVQIRIPDTSHWFAGINYIYIDSDTTVRTADIIPGMPDLNGTIKTAGLGLMVTYDSRDNNYFPAQGQWFESKWVDYGENWGGDMTYSKSTSFLNHYQPLYENVIVALRTRLQTSSGDVPFFDLPSLQMGGFSNGRYRDQNTWSFHSEGRYKFKPHWGLIGFYEVGWFNSKLGDIFDGRRITSYGTGLRWQVTENKQMHLGLDIAFSTDEEAIYIRIGERF